MFSRSTLYGEVLRAIEANQMTQKSFQKYINASTVTADLITGSIITTRNWDTSDGINTTSDFYIEMYKQMIMWKTGDTIVGAQGYVSDITGSANIFGTVYGAGGANDSSLNKGYINKDTNGFNVFFVNSSNSASGFQLADGAINATHPITIKDGLSTYFTLNASNWNKKLEEVNNNASTSLTHILQDTGKALGIKKNNFDSTVQTSLSNADSNNTLLNTTRLNESYIQDAALTASKLNVDQLIMSGATWSDNDPSSGYIKWTGSSIKVNLNGTTYAITASNTNKKFIYWTVGNSSFTTSDTRPTESDSVWMIAMNNSGVHQKAYYGKLAQKYIGSAFIDDLAVNDAHINSLTASKITAGTISAAVILGSTLATAAVNNARINIDSTNGFVKYDGYNYLRLQIASTGSTDSGGKILFSRESPRAEIKEESGNFVIRSLDASVPMILGHNTVANSNEMYGNWSFSNATISGFSVKFGS